MKKGNLKLIGIVAASIVAVVVLCVFLAQSFQNKAYRLEENVTAAKADVTLQEKRRAELIPNLVDCVKAYDEHEYKTLMDAIAARGTNSDESAAEIQTMIKAVAEAYPELKSNENYNKLMTELMTTENMILSYRENYNNQINTYKKYVRQFPTRPILNMLGYEVQSYKLLDYGDTYSEAQTNLFED